MSIATPAPIATSPRAPDSASVCSDDSVLDASSMFADETSVARAPTVAAFVIFTKLMPSDAAMLTSLDVPPEAAIPHATQSLRWPAAVSARTAIPAPLTCASAPIDARFEISA